MKENVKLGLLAVVTIATLVNSYFIFDLKENTISSNNKYNIPTSAPLTNNAVNNLNKPAPLTESKPSLPPTKISFENYTHSFGEVKQKTENAYDFVFTNTGDKPLVISDAKGSCGCTVPEYPKEPVLPGETAKISVVYSSRTSVGHQEKNVTITANTSPEKTILKISADVLKPIEEVVE